MGNLNLGALKPKKVAVSKKLGGSYEGRKFATQGSFGAKQGKNISLPKGNPPINR